MRADSRWPFHDSALDAVWVAFALASLLAMVLLPTWETVPFHFIWVSLTLVYGFRVWRTSRTAWTLGAVMLLTGLVLWHDVVEGTQPAEELTEVPLMASMFVAMVWHARRRLAATAQVQRISDDNRRLLEREKRFVEDASHQLRTPITIALGHAELIARHEGDGPSAEDAVVVVEELQRLRRLADLLLRIVGAEEGHAEPRSQVHIDVMVAETVRRWMVTPRAWTVGRLECATAIADADQLQMAVDELIQNAVSHTRPEDRITLGVQASEGWIVVRIADTGTGIGPREQDRIFDRFVRFDSAGHEQGGFGLGLSFVKSVAESHGGRVCVSSALGEGSTFELWIPMANDEDPLPEATSEPGRSPRAIALAGHGLPADADP